MHKDLRSQLLHAAAELLARDGVEAVTIRAVARSAGVTHGAPRRYFPSRAFLLAELAAAALADLSERVAPAISQSPTPGSIEAAALSYVRFAVEQPNAFELITRHDLLANSGRQLRQVSLPLHAQWCAAVRATSPNATTADANVLWAAVHGIGALGSRGSLELLGESAEGLVRHVIRRHFAQHAGAGSTTSS
jgi:AcrR family transcriptional regulator